MIGFGMSRYVLHEMQLCVGAMDLPYSMTLGGDNVSGGLDGRTGFVAGGFVKIDLGGPIGLRPEITYIQKGGIFRKKRA